METMLIVDSSSAASTLDDISRLLLIYGGFALFLTGILGSCANIYLFTMRRYRQIPCSLFIWMGTVFDLILLCIGLFLYHVLTAILGYDATTVNLFLCKTHLYLLDALLPIPIWFVCLSAFDRFCITSRNAVRRQWSTKKRSRMMAIALIVIFLIYRLPDLYYVNISPTDGPPICTFDSSANIYTSIHSYFTLPVLLTMAPVTLLLILSLDIRANLRLFTVQQAGARLERQITLMVFLQALGAVCVIPYAINIIYLLATKTIVKSEYRLAVENLIFQIVVLCFYVQYTLAFYIYFIVSSHVRQSVRLGWRKITDNMRLTNRVAPAIVAPYRVVVINVVS